MMDVYLNRTAVCLPNEPVDNAQMETLLGQAGERPSRARRLILKRNGIRTRYYAIDPRTGEANYTNARLTAEAVRGLFDTPQELAGVDCLVTGTTIADQLAPNHAVMVHGELGNPPCEAVATTGICLCGMSALKYAWLAVRAGEHRQAVATGSELASQFLHARHYQAEMQYSLETLEQRPELAFEKDFLRWMLSDGAGAALLGPEPDPAPRQAIARIEWIHILSHADRLETCMYAGAEKRPDGSLQSWLTLSPEECRQRSVLALKQDVRLLNEQIVEQTVTRTLGEVIRRTGLMPDDVDHFLPHLSSMYFRPRVAEALAAMDFAIPEAKWFTNLQDKGNTGSASIYIMLDELLKSDRVRSGDRILCFVPESGRFSSAYMLLSVP